MIFSPPALTSCKSTSRTFRLRPRLLGPLTTLAAAPAPQPDTTNDSAVEAAFRQVDLALDHLCTTLGLKTAA